MVTRKAWDDGVGSEVFVRTASVIRHCRTLRPKAETLESLNGFEFSKALGPKGIFALSNEVLAQRKRFEQGFTLTNY